MKKIVLCLTFAASSLLLHGAQSPHSKDDYQSHKHVVKTDSDLRKILHETRRQKLEDPKRTRRIFDADPATHNENKKG